MLKQVTRGRKSGVLAAAVAVGLLSGSSKPAFATAYSWNGTTDFWSTAAAWTPSSGPPSATGTDTLTFNGSGATAYTSTVDNNGGSIADPWVINAITLNSSATVTETIANSNANGFAFGGTTPSFTVASTDTGAFNISSAVSFNAATAFNINSGALTTFSGNWSGSGAVTVATSMTYSLGNALTNATIAETILSGSNTNYTGNILVAPGAGGSAAAAHVAVLSARSAGTAATNVLGTGNFGLLGNTTAVSNQAFAEAILEIVKIDAGNSSIYDLNRAIGTGPGQIAMQGSNNFSNVGFAAFGGTTLSNGVVVRSVGLSVSGVVTGTILSKIATLPVPNGGGDGYVFGSPTSNSTLVMVNGMDTEGTAANRNFRFIRGVGTQPEVMFTGQLRNGTNSGNTLNFGGTGGFIVNNVNPTGPFAAYANSNLEAGSAAGSDVGTSTGIVLFNFSAGGMFVGSNDVATNGSVSPISNSAATLTIGNNAVGNSGTNLGNINTGLMTYGNSVNAGGGALQASPVITIARNLVMGTGGTGIMTVGGFTPDHTAFTGTLNFSGVNTTLTAATNGQVDFTGVMSGAGNITVGNTIIEGVGTTFGSTAAGTGISVNGAGILRVTGNNTNTGNWTINNGTFRVDSATGSGTGTGTVAVNTGAVLAGAGTISGGVTLNSGAVLTPNAGAASGVNFSSLNVGSLTLNANTLNFNFTASGNDSVTTAGALTFNGTDSLNILNASGLTAGLYKIIGFGTTNGTSTSITVGTNSGPNTFSYSVIKNAAEYDLQVLSGSAKADIWTGATNGTWDTATTNWTSGGNAAIYQDGDTVTFDDTATNDAAHRNIAISIAVNPFSITVNSTGPYSFSGGTINGAASLLKTNTGTLTLNQTNNGFTGAVTLAQGTVQIAGWGSLGTGTTAISLGTPTTSDTLQFLTGAGTQTTTRGLTLLGATTLDTTTGAGAATVTVSGPITGTGALTLPGTGAVTLSSTTNTFTGSLSVAASTLTLGSMGVGGASTTLTLGSSGATASLVYNGGNFTDARVLGVPASTTSATINVATAATTLNYSAPLPASSIATLAKAGPGTLMLNNAATNTFTTSPSVAAGTLIISNNVIFPTPPVITAGTLVANGNTNGGFGATYSLAAGQTLQVGSGITGSATTSVTPLGTTSITLNGGTLSLTSGNRVGSGLTAQYYAVAPLVGNTDFASTAAQTNLFNALTPSVVALTSTGSHTNLDYSNTNYGTAAAFSSGGFNTTVNYQSLMTGKISITTPGSYTFATTSDDGSLLFIDGTLVVNNNAYQGATLKTGSITLTPGLHDIAVTFYQGNGGAGLLAQYTPPGTTGLTTIPNTVLAPAAPGGTTFLYGSIVSNFANVTASSTINSLGTMATVGTLTMNAGTTLTVNGGTFSNTGGITFSGFTPNTSGAYTFNVTGGSVDLGPISDTSTPKITSIVKSGLGNLIFDTAATQFAANTPITVSGGFVGLVGGTGGANINMSAITLNNGNTNLGGLALGTLTAGNFTFDQPLNITASTTILAGLVGQNGAVGSAATPIVVTLGNTTLTNLVLPAATTLQLEANNNYALNVTSVITGAAGGATTAGVIIEAGLVTFNGVNTYTGTTVINPAGTLRINSSASTAASAFTILGTLSNGGTVNGAASAQPYTAGFAGGVVKGEGTFKSTMAIGPTSTLAPGNNTASAVVAAPMTITGAVTFTGVVNNNAAFAISIGPTASNELIVGPSGSTNLGTGTNAFTTLALTGLGGNPGNLTYVLVDNQSSTAVTGTFQAVTYNGATITPVGNVYTIGGQAYTLTYTYDVEAGTGSLTTGNDIALAVPEPASMSLLAIGAAGLLARRRRRPTL